MEDPGRTLPAGEFSMWLADITSGRSRDDGADVPCGDCTACCTSSQFIHVAPDETATLAAIPAEVLFPAPGLPRGHVLMGFDQNGHCPMFVDGGCSIYDVRPRTCRQYDCRVFAAAGIVPDDAQKADIADRARRWAFDLSSEDDRAEHAAVQAAGAYLTAHPECLPDGVTPPPADLALLAIRIHGIFLDPTTEPHCSDVTEALRRCRGPGARRSR